MEIKRSTSPAPDLGGYDLSARRHTLASHRESLLTSSLPTSLVRREFSFFKSKSTDRSPIHMEDQLTEDVHVEKRTFFHRSHSNNVPSTSKAPRPRSASIHSSSNQLGGPGSAFKKIISRGGNPSRSRPSSARLSFRGRSHSQTAEQHEANAAKIDSAFAKIRSQLAQLSAEDVALQERLDNLTSQISHIQRYAASLHTSTRTSVSTAPPIAASCIGSPPPKPGPSVFPLDFWDGSREFKTDEQLPSPKCLQLRDGAKSERVSLGSCGSLADSEGSLSPRPCCRIVVVDYDFGKPQKFNYPYSSQYMYEDDVFLS